MQGVAASPLRCQKRRDTVYYYRSYKLQQRPARRGTRGHVVPAVSGVSSPLRSAAAAGAKLPHEFQRSSLLQTLEAYSKEPNCEEVFLHVQVGNDAALDFYKGFGFEVGDVVKDYYQRLDVNDAHLVSKKAPYVTADAS